MTTTTQPQPDRVPDSLRAQPGADLPPPQGFASIFITFLRLGCISFGGPIAHLGYFERAFVEQRKWLSGPQFAQLLTLCQFLPGPASSQMGFAIGLTRGGLRGGLAAFLGFTLPSAIALVLAAMLAQSTDGPVADAVIQGLKLVAVAVVAAGVLGLSRKLAPDAPRAMIAAVVAAAVVLVPMAWFQLVAVLAGGLLGAMLVPTPSPKDAGALPNRISSATSTICLVLFFGLLIGLPLLAAVTSVFGIDLAEAFYRAGALVFGGGHVVLPLLEQSVVEPGWLTRDEFLAGYGAAQAVPGPMFTLSAYLGTSIAGVHGAVIALLAIFVPGMLLVTGALPHWNTLSQSPKMARLLAGVNAAVLGLLGAALYDPVWTSAIFGARDFAIALIGFALLVAAKWSALWVVGWCVGASVLSMLVLG